MAKNQQLTLDFDAGLTEIYIPATGNTIRVNLEDVGLYRRVENAFRAIEQTIIPFSKSAEELQNLKAELGGEENEEFLNKLTGLLEQENQVDKDIRAILAECFGFDIGSAVFGTMSCLSPCQSAPTVLHSFMEYFAKLYSDSMAKLGAESNKRIAKYVKKYQKSDD